MITFPLATHTSRRMIPPWPGSSGVTLIQMEADKHGQYTNTPRLPGRPSAWRREPQHHPCRGYTLCQGSEASLSQAWPRGKTSRCLRPTFCFTLEKKKIYISVLQILTVVSWVRSLSSTLQGNPLLFPTFTHSSCLVPKEELPKIMRRDGMAHSELRHWPFWEALLQDGPGPVRRCFSPLFAQKLLDEKSPPFRSVRSQRTAL